MRCNVASCIPAGGEDAVRHQRRFHKPNVFDPPKPPPPWLLTAGAKLLSLPGQMKDILAKIYSSTYYWGIVKAVTMFLTGMKLFYDIASKLSADCEQQRDAQRKKAICDEWEKKHPRMKVYDED